MFVAHNHLGRTEKKNHILLAKNTIIHILISNNHSHCIHRGATMFVIKKWHSRAQTQSHKTQKMFSLIQLYDRVLSNPGCHPLSCLTPSYPHRTSPSCGEPRHCLAILCSGIWSERFPTNTHTNTAPQLILPVTHTCVYPSIFSRK